MSEERSFPSASRRKPRPFHASQALEFAERVHPDLAAAQAQVESAEGRALQAGLFPNPELVSRIEAAPVTGRIASRAEYVVGISQPAPLGQRLSSPAVLKRSIATAWGSMSGRGSAGMCGCACRVPLPPCCTGNASSKPGPKMSRLPRTGRVRKRTPGRRRHSGGSRPSRGGVGSSPLAREQAMSRRAQAIEALVTAIGESDLTRGIPRGLA